jgi:hypothetical protein
MIFLSFNSSPSAKFRLWAVLGEREPILGTKPIATYYFDVLCVTSRLFGKAAHAFKGEFHEVYPAPRG